MEKSNLIKLPLHQILLENGWHLKKEKCTATSKTLTNEYNDLVVVNKLANNDYVYFKPNSDDKGNIFNFAKNRGLKVEDLTGIKINANEEYFKRFTTKDDIKIKNENSKEIKYHIIKKFKQLPTLPFENYFSDKRKINPNILTAYKDIKTDNFQNVNIPTYIMKHNEIANKEILTLAGYVSYLKEPILSDKNGEAYKKPLKQLCQGSKGLEMLTNGNQNNTKNIIIAESSIDSISALEIKGFNQNETLLCATNGSITQSHKEIFSYLAQKLPNANVYCAFDNDKAGIEFFNKTKEYFEKAELIKPIFKDFNDDLIVAKTLNISPKELSKKAVLDKIINIDKKAQDYIKKHNFLTPFGKEESLKELRQSWKDYNAIKPKIESSISLNDIEKSFEEIIKISKNQQSHSKNI